MQIKSTHAFIEDILVGNIEEYIYLYSVLSTASWWPSTGDDEVQIL